MTREDILAEAGRLISGDRHDTYGGARENFAGIAAGWSAIFGRPVTAEQVALAMAWVKIARLKNAPGHLDSWTDLAGYAALGGEIATEQ